MHNLNINLEEKINHLENDLQKERDRLSAEVEGFEALKSLMEERILSLNKLNENNKELIKDLEYKGSEEKNKDNSIIDNLDNEMKMKNNLITLLKNEIEKYEFIEKNLSKDIYEIKKFYQEAQNKLNNEILKLTQENIKNENKYKKMLKDFEILAYKLNLENMNLKDKLDKINDLENKKLLISEKISYTRNKLTENNNIFSYNSSYSNKKENTENCIPTILISNNDINKTSFNNQVESKINFFHS